MKMHARVGREEIIFSSPLARSVFYSKHAGKDIFIEIDETPSKELRRYFEGCLVPVVYYTHPHAGWHSFKDAREALKLEFLTESIKDLRGHPVKIARSTNDLSREAFKMFVNAIVHWLLENQLVSESDIDSENYKRWRDATPLKGDIYPPLKRLKEYHVQARSRSEPWRTKNVDPNGS